MKKKELFNDNNLKLFKYNIPQLITSSNEKTQKPIDTLTSNEIIKLYYITQEEKIYSFTLNEETLLRKITLSTIDDDFKNYFKKIDVKKYENLFISLFSKIQNIKDINKLFELINYKELRSKTISESFISYFHKFKDELRHFNNDENELLSDIIVKTIVICHNNYVNYSIILEDIKGLNDNQFAFICPKIVKDFEGDLPDNIFDFIIGHLQSLNPEECINILLNGHSPYIINKFFENYEKSKELNEEDFFSIEEIENEKFNFFCLLIKNFFFEYYKEIDFIKKAK